MSVSNPDAALAQAAGLGKSGGKAEREGLQGQASGSGQDLPAEELDDLAITRELVRALPAAYAQDRMPSLLPRPRKVE